MYYVKKGFVLGVLVFRIIEIRGDDNETGLKEGGGIEIEIYSAFPYYAMHALSIRFFVFYLPVNIFRIDMASLFFSRVNNFSAFCLLLVSVAIICCAEVNAE